MTTLSACTATIYTYKSQWGRYFCKLDYLWVSILGVMKIGCGGGQSLSQAIYLYHVCMVQLAYMSVGVLVLGVLVSMFVDVRQSMLIYTLKLPLFLSSSSVSCYTPTHMHVHTRVHAHTHTLTHTPHTHHTHTHTHTAITIQFTSSVFAADYDPTIGE